MAGSEPIAFGGRSAKTAEHGVIWHYPEDGNGISLRNVGRFELPDAAVSLTELY